MYSDYIFRLNLTKQGAINQKPRETSYSAGFHFFHQLRLSLYLPEASSLSFLDLLIPIHRQFAQLLFYA